ncbi:MAG TPA: hypothetical protein VFS43_35845 [Polyangiaceae bacterium]|nr:hypothetical protein [Polyangiaceae bacterium]
MGGGERSSGGAGVDDVRYQRQIVLREVGYEGQARIAASVARVPVEGLAGEVAALYARRAGFGAVVDAPGEAPRAPDWVASPAAAEIVSGSLAALAAFAGAVLGGAEGGAR